MGKSAANYSGLENIYLFFLQRILFKVDFHANFILDELIREVDQDGEGMVNYGDVVRVLLA